MHVPTSFWIVCRWQGQAEAASAVRNGIGDAFFQRLDDNSEGIVTRDEVRTALPNNPNAAGSVFDRLDTDKNGKLDKTEFEALKKLLNR